MICPHIGGAQCAGGRDTNIYGKLCSMRTSADEVIESQCCDTESREKMGEDMHKKRINLGEKNIPWVNGYIGC